MRVNSRRYPVMARRHALAGLAIMATQLLGCWRLYLPAGVSDVPCIEPAAWPEEVGGFLARRVAADRGVLLLTFRTSEQRHTDEEDGVVGNGPHGPVYELSASTGVFELAEDEIWDEGGLPVTNCSAGLAMLGPFGVGDGLEFNGEHVPTSGETVLRVKGAPKSPVVAVLSTTGIPGGMPLLTVTGASGQHYHQLFSKIDGSPIGAPVRLGVGGPGTGLVDVCWTLEEDFVIYAQSNPSGEGSALLCVVEVSDELAAFHDGSP